MTMPEVKKPERLLYRVIHNLVVHEYKITRESLVTSLLDGLQRGVQDRVTAWLYGDAMRKFIGDVARDAVNRMAGSILREEARKFLDRRIHLDIGLTITPPEDR